MKPNPERRYKKMAKIILYVSVFVLLHPTKGFSQETRNAKHIHLSQLVEKSAQAENETSFPLMKSEPVIIAGISLREGTNTITVPGGKGTLTFLKKNDFFSNVIFTDAGGITSRLVPGNNIPGAPKPICPFPIPEAWFVSSGSIGLSICRASGIVGKPALFTLSLLLPAVSKMRTA